MFLFYTLGGSTEPDISMSRLKQQPSTTEQVKHFLDQNMMAAHIGSSAPVSTSRSDGPVFPPVSLSAEAAPFTPLAADSWRLGGSSPDVETQFSRCAAKLRALRADSSQLREQLNLLLDQLLSENYNKTLEPNINIRPEVTHGFNVTCFTRMQSCCCLATSQRHHSHVISNAVCSHPSKKPVLQFLNVMFLLINQINEHLEESLLSRSDILGSFPPISGHVQCAETCQLSCATESGAFGHQTVPASTSSTQSAKGNH